MGRASSMHRVCHHRVPGLLPHCTSCSLMAWLSAPGQCLSCHQTWLRAGGADPRWAAAMPSAAAEGPLFLLCTPFFLPTFKLWRTFSVFISPVSDTINKETTIRQQTKATGRKQRGLKDSVRGLKLWLLPRAWGAFTIPNTVRDHGSLWRLGVTEDLLSSRQSSKPSYRGTWSEPASLLCTDSRLLAGDLDNEEDSISSSRGLLPQWAPERPNGCP